jgi:hypothetical protein
MVSSLRSGKHRLFFDRLRKLENNSAKALAVAGPMRILRLLDEAGPHRLSAPLAVSDVV